MKILLCLLSLIQLVACRTHVYSVKLDPQLYTLPLSYGQKSVGLIYYRRSNPLFSFDSEKPLNIYIPGEVRKLGGNRIIPLAMIKRARTISERLKGRSNELLVKGFVVNDLSK